MKCPECGKIMYFTGSYMGFPEWQCFDCNYVKTKLNYDDKEEGDDKN